MILEITILLGEFGSLDMSNEQYYKESSLTFGDIFCSINKFCHFATFPYFNVLVLIKICFS